MRNFSTPVFYAFVILCLFSIKNSYAQTAEKILIQGRIIDSKDKLPVIGATVIEQDQDNRTVTGVATNIDGEFALKVSNTSHKLVISMISYKTVGLTIGTRRVFNISLEAGANDLEEVKIVAQSQSNNGTGLSIDTRDLTTSTVTLNAKDVEDLAATSIDQAIQGRLPGVDIVANSGDPGAGMSIKIRGTSSINGVTNPLIVVDGVPFDTQVPSDFNFATADNSQYADLLSIAPSDVATISILKDVAATAVWGSRAASGVLIITTKRGQKGPPTISYTFKGTMQKQPRGIPMLTGDEYTTLIPEEIINGGGVLLNTFTIGKGREFENDPLDLYYYKNYSQNTDWVKAVTQTGSQLDHNLSISGGGDKARYFASVGYVHQTGTTINSSLGRLNTRLNLDYNVSNKIKFTTFFSFSHSNTQDLYGGSGSIRSIAAIKMPNSSIYEYNDLGQLTSNYFSPAANIQGSYSNTFNPVAMANAALNNSITDRITPHFFLQYKLSEPFQATADVSFDINNGNNVSFLPQIATGRPFTETNVNKASTNDFDTYSVSTKINLIYTPNFGDKNSFQALVSLQSEDDKQQQQSQTTANSATSSITDPSAPARTASSGLSIGSGISQTRSVSALANAQYKFLDRYIINASLRADGSSRFGPGSRFGYFPAISARYRLSGEPFMKRYSNWLDELSLRGGYGTSGGSPGSDYSFYSNYLSTSSPYSGLAGLVPNSIRLDHLRWETVVGTEVGINIILFKNRLNVDFDLYKKRTKNLITDQSIANYEGFDDVTLNVGTLDNQGFELSIFSTPYKSKSLSIDFNFNISNNINALRSISPYYATTSGNVTTNGSYLKILQLNNPLGSFYGYKFKGVYKDADATIARDARGNQIISPNGTPLQMRFNYPASNYQFVPGDAMYEDINHDGNINFQDVVYLGNGSPDFTGGFGPTLTYKGKFTLTPYFNYRLGGQVINGTKISTTNLSGFNNQSTAVLRRWRTSGDVTDIPRAVIGSGYGTLGNYNSLGSDRYVENDSFLRLGSITARYNFSKQTANLIKAKNLNVYITLQNVLTFTNYTGQDPEVPTGGGIYQIAQDNSTTPPLKQYTIGLSASF